MRQEKTNSGSSRQVEQTELLTEYSLVTKTQDGIIKKCGISL